MVRSTRFTSKHPNCSQENKSLDNIANYTFSVVMFDRNAGVSKEQQNTINIFEQILSAIKTHLKKEETKDALNQLQLDALVDMMDIFYRKKEKGKLVSGVPPPPHVVSQAANQIRKD